MAWINYIDRKYNRFQVNPLTYLPHGQIIENMIFGRGKDILGLDPDNMDDMVIHMDLEMIYIDDLDTRHDMSYYHYEPKTHRGSIVLYKKGLKYANMQCGRY
jgi:hypothetical protein